MRKVFWFSILFSIIFFVGHLRGYEVVQTINVGMGPHRSVVIPDGSKAYVVNRDSDEVTVLNLQVFPHTVLKHIPVGDGPSSITQTPTGERVYVLNRAAGTISVVDTQQDVLIDTIDGVGSLPSTMAITPDGNYLYVSNNNSVVDLRVVRINLRTMEIETFFNAAPYVPQSIYFSPDNKIGFFGMQPVQNTNIFTEIRDLKTGVLLDTIPGLMPAAVSKKGNVLFMINQFSQPALVSAFNIKNLSAITPLWTTEVKPRPAASFVFGKREAELFMVNDTSNIMTILNTSTGSLIQEIPVGILPCGISITPGFSYVYIGNLGSNTVSVVKLEP